MSNIITTYNVESLSLSLSLFLSLSHLVIPYWSTVCAVANKITVGGGGWGTEEEVP